MSPTVRELGFPVLEADGWNGVFAPAKTPRAVIDRLQKEIAAAVHQPETAKRLTRDRRRADRLEPGGAGRDPEAPGRAVPG